jgi:hypothetical protein
MKTESGLNDPMNVARNEGMVFGTGVSGRYKKNFITQTGFILLGTLCFVLGIGMIRMAYDLVFNPVQRDTTELIITCVVYFVLFLALTTVGFFMIKNAIKKTINPKKRHHQK